MEVIQPSYQRAQKWEVHDQAITGFQSPAHDYRVKDLCLNELLVRVPHATFFVWVDESQIDGIEPGDLLVINRARRLVGGAIALIVLDGHFTLRRLLKRGERWIALTDQVSTELLIDETVTLWGLVDATIRLHRD